MLEVATTEGGASERKKGKLPSHQQEGAESNPEHDSQEESTLVKQ